jgi:hypothetical protein
MNETISTRNLTSTVEGVVAAPTHIVASAYLILLDDMFEAIDDVIEQDEMTDDVALSIMTRLRTIDPTESGIAAEIRDYLRDNSDVEGI